MGLICSLSNSVGILYIYCHSTLGSCALAWDFGIISVKYVQNAPEKKFGLDQRHLTGLVFIITDNIPHCMKIKIIAT